MDGVRQLCCRIKYRRLYTGLTENRICPWFMLQASEMPYLRILRGEGEFYKTLHGSCNVDIHAYTCIYGGHVRNVIINPLTA